MEQWLNVKGFEDVYKVSNLGRIKSIPRHGTRGGILKQSTNTVGRLRVTLCKGNKTRDTQIHRLVAEAFLENKSGKPCVCHKDGNPINNKVGNLYWGTYKENEFDKKRHGTVARGETQGSSKLRETDVVKMRKMYSKGIRQVELAKIFSTDQTNVSLIVRRLAWKHVK